MKVIELIEHHGARLAQAGVSFGHGTTNAFDEAAWLVLWGLDLPLDGLDEAADTEVEPAARARVGALVDERIRTRKPAAYLTGMAWLQGVSFLVDDRVIVPRSLIAEPLAEGVLDAWFPTGTGRVLDLCTGSGSLAVLAAMAWPEARVVATDLSADALSVAARNVQRHGLSGRIALAQGDGWAAAPGRFDLVLCNPPYVNRASMQSLPPEYQAEPALALDGGEDGMDFIRRLLATAHDHLTEPGALVLEIGHERAFFEAAFPGLEPLWLTTSAGEDQVMLLEADTLAAWRARAPGGPA